MEKTKKPYFSSALWPGIILGLLSIIPIVNYVNFVCCLWVIAGGVLAAVVFKQEAGEIDVGKGAFVGFVAGMIGAVVQTIGTGVLWYFFKANYLADIYEIFETGNVDQAVQDTIANFINNPGLLVIGALLSALISNGIFGTFGGLIGAAFLKGKNSNVEGQEVDSEN